MFEKKVPLSDSVVRSLHTRKSKNMMKYKQTDLSENVMEFDENNSQEHPQLTARAQRALKTRKKILETALRKVDMYESWRPLDPGRGHSTDERFAAMPAVAREISGTISPTVFCRTTWI